MGRQWVGFQAMVKPVPGRRVIESATFTPTVSDAEAVALLTTRAGIERWIAPVVKFSDRRGGTIDFLSEAGSFGGSFTLVDIPRRVVLVTDVHGEIDVRLRMRARPTELTVTVTRFVPSDEDENAVVELMQGTIAELRKWCTLEG